MQVHFADGWTDSLIFQIVIRRIAVYLVIKMRGTILYLKNKKSLGTKPPIGKLKRLYMGQDENQV